MNDSKLADAAIAENVALKRELATSKETLELASRELAAAKRANATLEAKLEEAQTVKATAAVSDAEVLGVVAPELKEALHEIEKVKKELASAKEDYDVLNADCREYKIALERSDKVSYELQLMCEEMYEKVEKAETTILELDRALTKAGYTSAQFRNTLVCICNMLRRQFPEVDLDNSPDVVASLVREYEKSQATAAKRPSMNLLAAQRMKERDESHDVVTEVKAEPAISRDEIDILLAEGV